MNIIGKCLTRDEFTKYVKDHNFGTQPADKLVIHHTWKPTKKDWAGEPTLFGIKRYYERKGWNAGPHLFIADDGIWLFTDMRKDGIHAGAGNHRSIGIEVVGDYNDKVWEGETKKNTLHAISELLKRLKIDSYTNLKFHRDYSSKSCPGWAITKEWLLNELNNMSNNEPINSDLSSLIKKDEHDLRVRQKEALSLLQEAEELYQAGMNMIKEAEGKRSDAIKELEEIDKEFDVLRVKVLDIIN